MTLWQIPHPGQPASDPLAGSWHSVQPTPMGGSIQTGVGMTCSKGILGILVQWWAVGGATEGPGAWPCQVTNRTEDKAGSWDGEASDLGTAPRKQAPGGPAVPRKGTGPSAESGSGNSALSWQTDVLRKNRLSKWYFHLLRSKVREK